MAERVEQVQWLTLNQAAREVPGGPDPSTVHRWIRRGINGVCLSAVRAGARWYTTREALDDFFEQLAEAKRSPAARYEPDADEAEADDVRRVEQARRSLRAHRV